MPTREKKSSTRELTILSESERYRDYEQAFTAGTGLPLNLHAPDIALV